MEPSTETELLAERIDDQQVALEHARERLHVERALADRLAAALYARGFTANQLDALASYEVLRTRSGDPR